MTQPPDLSVIIVNWNSAEFVRKCLSSVNSTVQDLKVETIVIDNASYDGCGGIIAREFPEVKFIQSEVNLGFSAANNLAFTKSCGELVLFLNPDTEVSEGAIQRMVSIVRATHDAGIVGAKLLNSDGSVQTSCVQKFPTILGLVLDSALLRTALPRWSLWGMRPLFDNPVEAAEVDAISGACQIMKRDTFLRARMYSTSYFMYVEDVDLCLRVRRLGLRNLYVPDAVVVHHGGKSSEGREEAGHSAVLMREGWKHYFERNRGAGYARAFQIAVGIQAAVRLLLVSVAAICSNLSGKAGKFAQMRRKWATILRWALGLEPWASRLRTN